MVEHFRRERRIEIIKKLKATIRKARENSVKIDKEKLINEMGCDGVQRRTALEYLKNAGFFDLKNAKLQL